MFVMDEQIASTHYQPIHSRLLKGYALESTEGI
jgi:hypothetical protein